LLKAVPKPVNSSALVGSLHKVALTSGFDFNRFGRLWIPGQRGAVKVDFEVLAIRDFPGVRKTRALEVAASAREREGKIRAAIKTRSVASAASAKAHADLLNRVAQHFDGIAAGKVKLQISNLTVDDLPNRKPTLRVNGRSFSRVTGRGSSGNLGRFIRGTQAYRPSFRD
jgi:hypothetical protein